MYKRRKTTHSIAKLIELERYTNPRLATLSMPSGWRTLTLDALDTLGDDLSSSTLCILVYDSQHKDLDLATMSRVLSSAHAQSTVYGLTLRNCGLESPHSLALASVLPNLNALLTLNLSHNTLAGDDMSVLSEALHHNDMLTDLNIAHNNLGLYDNRNGERCESGMEALGECLRTMDRLRKLDVSDNKLGLQGCKALATALRHYPRLHELKLPGNDILFPMKCDCEVADPSGLQDLCEVLKSMPSLTMLDVSRNGIGMLVVPDGWGAGDECFERQDGHTDLDWPADSKRTGVRILADLVLALPCLVHLKAHTNLLFYENEYSEGDTKSCVSAWCDAIRGAPHLQLLDVTKNTSDNVWATVPYMAQLAEPCRERGVVLVV